MNHKIEKAARSLLAMQRYPWEQGCAMQAFYEWGRMEEVISLAYEAVYRRQKDGRAASIGATDTVTDPCSVGEALIAACDMTGDEELIAGRDALLEWALHKAPRNAEGILYHLDTSCQFWVDSMYMLPPFLAAAGCYKEALINFYGYYEALYDAESGLMCHMWDDDSQTYLRRAHWGTGNGWALASMVRMLKLLPDTYEKDRERIRGMAEGLLGKALSYRREDGLFHDVLDDKNSFVEVNFAQMAAYTIYSGLYAGWLSEKWKKEAVVMREAANGRMNEYGFICGVCGAPNFDKPGISPEGQTFYLLMEHAAAVYERQQEMKKAGQEEEG